LHLNKEDLVSDACLCEEKEKEEERERERESCVFACVSGVCVIREKHISANA